MSAVSCELSVSTKEAMGLLSPMASLVLTDSFEKLPDQIMYLYAGPYDLQKHRKTTTSDATGRTSTTDQRLFTRSGRRLFHPSLRLNLDLVRVHPTEIRTSISPSSTVELNTTSALANYATEAAIGSSVFLRRDVLNLLHTGSDRNEGSTSASSTLVLNLHMLTTTDINSPKKRLETSRDCLTPKHIFHTDVTPRGESSPVMCSRFGSPPNIYVQKALVLSSGLDPFQGVFGRDSDINMSQSMFSIRTQLFQILPASGEVPSSREKTLPRGCFKSDLEVFGKDGSEPTFAWRESGKPSRKNPSQFTRPRFEPRSPRPQQSSSTRIARWPTTPPRQVFNVGTECLDLGHNNSYPSVAFDERSPSRHLVAFDGYLFISTSNSTHQGERERVIEHERECEIPNTWR
uniref:Uncharacterized protein n=1 Tax=Timema monikensis TaxID=170555 RepID=A0A7R9E818_9NEOP|nr:unnamed protein product [Timema monikensis]